jgi:predicted lipid-binding transport protein (Tim44 family)
MGLEDDYGLSGDPLAEYHALNLRLIGGELFAISIGLAVLGLYLGFIGRAILGGIVFLSAAIVLTVTSFLITQRIRRLEGRVLQPGEAAGELAMLLLIEFGSASIILGFVPGIAVFILFGIILLIVGWAMWVERSDEASYRPQAFWIMEAVTVGVVVWIGITFLFNHTYFGL